MKEKPKTKLKIRPSWFLLSCCASWLLVTGCAGPGEAYDPSSKRSAVRASGPKVSANLPLSSAASQVVQQDRRTMVATSLKMLRQGQITDALSVADNTKDRHASATIEWAAFRLAPRQMSYDRLVQFLDQHPDWPSQGWLRRRIEETLWRENRDSTTTSAYFQRYEPLSPEGRAALANVKMQSGDRSSAVKLIQSAYLDDKLDDETEQALIARFSSIITTDLHRQRARKMVLNEKYAAAQKAAQRAGSDYSQLVNTAIAIARKQQASLSGVSSSLRQDPLYIFASAQAARRAERLQEAASIMAQGPQDAAGMGSPDGWWTERRVLSRALIRTSDFRNAYRVAADHQGGTEQTEMEADFTAGWIALRFLNDPRSASRHFAEISSRAQTPISRARGFYWQGRAAEAQGDSGSARSFYENAARFETVFYGQLAKNKLGIQALRLRAAPEPSSSDRANFEGREAIQAMKMLFELDEDALATGLLNDYAQRLDREAELVLLADVARRMGKPRDILTVGKAAIQRGLPLEDIAFPTNGVPNYKRVDYSVDRAMALAIARQESLFDPRATSHAGAKGLMQMMNATAAKTASRAGVPFSANKLYDADYNAMLGAAHLGELMQEFNGSYIMTFAAYNAGSARVREWVQTFGDPRDPSIDPLDWIEAIPFSETRNYVQRVMENYQVYKAKIGPRTALTIEQDLRGSSSQLASSSRE